MAEKEELLKIIEENPEIETEILLLIQLIKQAFKKMRKQKEKTDNGRQD